MRIALRLGTLVLSTSTFMCSAPADPLDNVGGGPPLAPSSAGAGGSIVPAGGTAAAGTTTGGGSAGTGSDTIGGTSTSGNGGGATAGVSGGPSTGSTATPGCSLPDPGEEPQKWLERAITVQGVAADQQATFGARRYFVRLPVAYDHTRKYPIVFYGPGCGAKNVESTPMMDQIKNDAIHVFLLQKSDCFSTGYPSPEVPYVAQALTEVQAKYCTDAKRVFVSGYSSGSWLSNVVACALGDKIRGIGTAAGGLRKETVDGYRCRTPVAGVLYSGELDMTNPANRLDMNGNQIGVIGARDHLIRINGCDPNSGHTLESNPICQEWTAGCPSNPVYYCVGPGDGHNKGDGKFNVSNQLFWEVWSKLP
jgi:hypothetical protein